MTRKTDNSGKSAAFRDPFAVSSPQRRKTGSRAKLAKRFFEDVYAAWEEQGESVIARAFFHDPVASMQMVARLMPQKIEISTPADGMSDERLAEMLEYAERMAGLKAEAARVIQADAPGLAALPSPSHKLADENADLPDAPERGAGGRCGEMGVGGENTPSTIAAERAETADTPERHNKLEPAKLPYPVGRPFAEPDHSVSARNRAALQQIDPVDPNSLF